VWRSYCQMQYLLNVIKRFAYYWSGANFFLAPQLMRMHHFCRLEALEDVGTGTRFMADGERRQNTDF